MINLTNSPKVFVDIFIFLVLIMSNDLYHFLDCNRKKEQYLTSIFPFQLSSQFESPHRSDGSQRNQRYLRKEAGIDWFQQRKKRQVRKTKFNSLMKYNCCNRHFFSTVFSPLPLMQATTGKVVDVCKKILDSESRIALLPPPLVPHSTPITSTCSVKNVRRRNEDRYMAIQDLDGIFNTNRVQLSPHLIPHQADMLNF